MALEIKGKSLEDDVQPADGRDAHRWERDGTEPGQSIPPGPGGSTKNGKHTVMEDYRKPDSPLPSFSLDELDDFSGDMPDLFCDGGADAEPSAVHTDDIEKSPPPAGEPSGKPVRIDRRRLALMAIVPCLVILTAGFLVSRWWSKPHKPVEVTRIITQPVPVPLYEEELDFFLLSGTAQGKEIVTIRLQFQFVGSNRSMSKRDEVLFRDVTYSFLKQHTVTKNSFSSWQEIVANELPGHIRTALPQSHLRTVRIRRLDRL